MRKCKEHLLIQIEQPIYDHLMRLSEKSQLPIQELVSRFINLGLIEERKGPLYFEEDDKKIRINMYKSEKEERLPIEREGAS
jgi:hypothetical protein